MASKFLFQVVLLPSFQRFFVWTVYKGQQSPIEKHLFIWVGEWDDDGMLLKQNVEQNAPPSKIIGYSMGEYNLNTVQVGLGTHGILKKLKSLLNINNYFRTKAIAIELNLKT